MAVLALDAVTLASITDVQYMRRYYLLQSSTLAAPTVPTTNPPVGSWSTTEPTYTEGSTNSLYVTDLVVFSDSTFDYLPVQRSSSYEAAKVAYNKAVAAAAAAQAANDNAVSRGTDLVTNGTGILGNVNWSQFTESMTDDVPVGAARAWTDPLSPGSRVRDCDEFMPVDVSKKVIATCYVKQLGTSTTSLAYLTLMPYDQYKNLISPTHVAYIPGTTTTLAAPLNPGDTVIKLTSSAGWYGTPGKNAGSSTFLRAIIFWDYVDAGGKAWPPETYSRNNTAVDLWADGGVSTDGTITLRNKWTGAAKPAGTPLSNMTSGPGRIYPAGNRAIKPADGWYRMVGVPVSGVAQGGAIPDAVKAWPYGTAFCKIGALSNYAPDTANSRHAWAGFSLSDASAAQAAADLAYTTASGKNKVTWSFGDAPTGVNGASGTTPGDVWNKYVNAIDGKDGTSKTTIVKAWTSDGTAWKPSLISESYLAQVNIGTGTYGELDGIRLKAQTVIANNVVVPGSVGNVLIGDGAVNARTVDAESVAGKIGSFLAVDAGQLTVTGNTTLNQAVAQRFFADIFNGNKITANEVNAASVGGAVGQFVNIQAEQITGGVITSTIGMYADGQMVAGAWWGSCAVMSAQEGFATKQVSDDGQQYTATNLGNPNGSNSLSIFPGANQPASFEVSADGAASANELLVRSDPMVAGRPLLGKTIDLASDAGWLDDIGRGTVARGDLREIMSSASFVGGGGTLTPLGVIAFVMQPARLYRLTMSMRYAASAVTDATKARVGAVLKYTFANAATNTEPAEPTASSTHVHDSLVAVPASGIYGAGHTMSVVWPSTFAGPQNVKLLVGSWANHCTMQTDTYNPFDWQLTVEDIGPLAPSTVRLLDTSGASTPPPAKRTYVSTWTANQSRSYYGTGSQDSFSTGKNILRHGYWDGATGDTRSAFACSGGASAGETGKTIATALNGATVSKVEVWVQSLHWYNSSGGTAILRPLGANSVPSTLPTGNVPSTAASKKFTTRVQGQWITVPNNWVTGTQTGIVLGPTASTSRAGYGYFADHAHPTDAYRPRIRITYTR